VRPARGAGQSGKELVAAVPWKPHILRKHWPNIGVLETKPSHGFSNPCCCYAWSSLEPDYSLMSPFSRQSGRLMKPNTRAEFAQSVRLRDRLTTAVCNPFLPFPSSILASSKTSSRGSCPTRTFVSMLTVTGRSVLRRRVRHGTPR
jgi:hypothetical protein